MGERGNDERLSLVTHVTGVDLPWLATLKLTGARSQGTIRRAQGWAFLIRFPEASRSSSSRSRSLLPPRRSGSPPKRKRPRVRTHGRGCGTGIARLTAPLRHLDWHLDRTTTAFIWPSKSRPSYFVSTLVVTRFRAGSTSKGFLTRMISRDSPRLIGGPLLHRGPRCTQPSLKPSTAHKPIGSTPSREALTTFRR